MSKASVDGLPVPVTRKDTVLVVVHEPIMRAVIADYLRDCEYKVIETMNADEALVVLRQSNMLIDVFFGDTEISGSISATALAQWVQTHRPEIRIILTRTVSEAAQAAGDLCERGPTMSRPYAPETMVEKIKKLLSNRHS